MVSYEFTHSNYLRKRNDTDLRRIKKMFRRYEIEYTKRSQSRNILCYDRHVMHIGADIDLSLKIWNPQVDCCMSSNICMRNHVTIAMEWPWMCSGVWPRNPSPSLRWRHNGGDSVSNHQPHDCLLNRLFRRRSKKTSKLRVTVLWAETSPGTGEFPAQMASYAENISIWWRHDDIPSMQHLR